MRDFEVGGKCGNLLELSIEIAGLWSEAVIVVAQRSAKLAMGGEAACVEAQLMVVEKVVAGFELSLALASGGLGRDAHAVTRHTLRHLRGKVSANRRRLG